MSQPTSDRERGVFGGRVVARVAQSPDGLTVLVGKAAKDNDTVSFKLSRPYDFWFHVAGTSGSHVVVLNDQRLDRPPRATKDFAASLAVGYSKAKSGGQSLVHWAKCSELRKPRGAAPGKVALRKYEQTKARPNRLED